MNIELVLADKENANIIRNIYPLYLYDLSEVYGNYPNPFGIYEEESVRTLEEQYHIQDVWFRNPDFLFPFIIFADRKPAGFILIASGKYSPEGTDYFVHEFFLLRPHRGKNIAEIAAKEVFDRFRGTWALYTNPTDQNRKAQTFWRKTVSTYTSGKFTTSVGKTIDGEKLIFRFTSPA